MQSLKPRARRIRTVVLRNERHVILIVQNFLCTFRRIFVCIGGLIFGMWKKDINFAIRHNKPLPALTTALFFHRRIYLIHTKDLEKASRFRPSGNLVRFERQHASQHITLGEKDLFDLLK
jgi:hypothetical protein